jgi:hypothetical protein
MGARMRNAILLALCLAGSVLQMKGDGRTMESRHEGHRGKAFVAITDFKKFEDGETAAPGERTLTSPELPLGLSANEIIVSWNADAPEGTGIRVEAKALYTDHASKWYTLALWSKDAKAFPRESVAGQKDADGDVHTDTLALKRPTDRLQLRVTLNRSAEGKTPALKFLGVSSTDTHAVPAPLEPDHAIWGKEVVVPGRTQLGWPNAAGWCSPTSTDMVLAFWAEKKHRPELDLPVPDVAHAIYDKVYDGTGNWPFNTAFAGSFPGIRAYVSRFSDIRELEEWVGAGLPPIVSVSYDLLRGKGTDNDPGHLMVCDGFTATGDIVLNDPAHHPERGEACRRVFSRANFLKAWAKSHNTVYLIYPEGTKRPANRYGHWE